MADYEVEKDVSKVDYLERSATAEAIDARINRFTPAEQRKIIRRIDRRLVLTLGFLYCVSLMDRTNLGIAVVAGMGVDLILTGSRYSIIVLVFFITYTLLQVFFSPQTAPERQILTIVTAPCDGRFAKNRPTHVSPNHHPSLGNNDDMLRFR